MLSKENRLSNGEFAKYYKIGKRSQSDLFTVVVYPNDKFKASVVVGKKVYKNAVDRNKTKRRIYSKLQKYKTKEIILIVLVKPAFSKLSKKQQQTETENFIGRVIK